MQVDLIDAFLTRLYMCSHRLTRQQFKTLRGQALAGDIAGAEKGLERLLTRGEKP
jgi:hypothetical protein